MTAVTVWGSIPPVEARVNWGRWIADCPACGSALTIPRGQQNLGAWTPDGFAGGCWDCGTRTRILWPAEQLAAGVERLLSMRPDPATRNWSPGETLADLLAENVQAGIFGSLELPEGWAFAVDDERILIDHLPATRSLDARPARQQIGA